MSRPQKIITIILWIVAVTAMLGVVAMKMIPPNAAAISPIQGDPSSPIAGRVIADPGDAPGAALGVLYNAPSFSLIDQDSKPATNAQLLGHPWVADFIFTTCASLCPTMSAHMSDLQDRLPADVKFVSFSVDPTHDNPAALLQYAARYHAQPGRWFFLTGEEKDQDQVIRGMRMGFVPATDGNPIEHDEHFVLVDGKGRIRGFYDSFVAGQLDRLVQDADELSAHPDGAGR